MNEYSFRWSDGKTELLIRKNGRLNQEKTVFSVESYHVFYTQIETQDMVNSKEKQLEETETAPGIKDPYFSSEKTGQRSRAPYHQNVMALVHCRFA
jgi:hypothetical protein